MGACLGCGGEGPDDWTEGRPRIDWLRYLQQEPAAPTDLQFALAFFDGDGDVGSGTLELFVQEQASSSIASSELFAAQTPPVARDATGGVLEFVVGLEPTIPVGARVRVGVELVDAEGRRSNRPSIELRVVGEQGGGS